ncbi:RNA-binding protein [Streptomyces sp. NPDC029216]|uniref:RNA-binding protein n=1 Tax=Streptomyces sp. NPDC029216 TaxID=3154701 RepID=UPI0033D8BAAF
MTTTGSNVPPFVHRITKYDPADRDRHGHYTGTEDTVSDHGPVESAYLEAIAAFAEESGVDRLAVREPCEGALSRTRALGLFPERLERSPYGEGPGEEEPQRPADEGFWAQLRWLLALRRAVVLEEGYLYNASRRHRLTEGTLDAARARLTPRARLTVWPDLSPDVGAVLAALPEDDTVELIWEDSEGLITSVIADESDHQRLTDLVATARAAAAVPLTLDGRHPLLTAVLPDADGILRARWRTGPTANDRLWPLLSTLRCRRTGEVSACGV